jgi:hypothetical protein
MNVAKGILSLSLAVAALTGCATAHSQDKTVVISDNVAIKSSMDDAEVAISKPQDITLTESVTYSEMLGIHNDQLYFNRKDGLAKTSLTTGQTFQVKGRPFQEMSKDGRRAFYVDDAGIYVYHVDTDKIVRVADSTTNSVTFADPKGEYIAYFDSTDLSYVFIHTVTFEKKKVDMQVQFPVSVYSIAGGTVYKDKIYMSFQHPEEGTAIYKLSANQKELILSFPHKEDRMVQFHIINDQLLVFNGTYNEESGIFFYEIDKQVVQKVVSGGKTTEGIWLPFYSISPDGTKILFDESAPEDGHFYTNVYLANIAGNQLSKSIRIIERAQFPAVISMLAHWKADSSAFYIPKSKQLGEGYSNETITHLSKYEIDKIKPKNETTGD